MGADFSKVRSNPLLDYAGVELKQGAVLLDADANEQGAIFDRRLRALASDVLGTATVGANTPDAFRITLGATSTGAQTLLIGPGRLYVDGLLAENHGNPDPAQRVFDALMAEPAFREPIPYETQPYLPNPPPLPRAGRHLVYLDVWKREVTHLERPDLVETAVGVETSSRLQTVWQVRVLGEEAGSGTTCGSPDAELAGWPDLVAPSTGRLTTGTYEVAAVTDPCELPPTGGYRGLENQLYRVEIQDPGQPGGTATFKWSRDNASVGSRVAACITASELQLDTLGRDEVLRINSGDWVEIIDDVREFSQRGGEIRKATVVAGKDRHITLNAALPADMLPGSFPDNSFPGQRNMRVRLWNQRGAVLSTAGNGTTAVFQDLDDAASTGLIKVPAAGTTLLLENGVTVSFDSVGQKGFRAGDYWVFSARTADASVELLDKAAPRGIHHHYARLSLWDAGTNNAPTDCRHHWPPAGGGDDCACTQCVTPGSHASGQLTIGDAIGRVQETGGTVCLKAGEYALVDLVRVTGARNVRIRGEGRATKLLAPGGAFSFESCLTLTLENLEIITAGTLPAVSVRSGLSLALHDLSIIVANPDAKAAAIALSGAILGLTIRDNIVFSPLGIAGPDSDAPAPGNLLMTSMLRIENNAMACQRTALELSGFVWHMQGTHVVGNDISGCREPAVNMLGSALIGSSVHIENNTLSVNGPGIRCANNFAWIQGNRLTAVVQGDRAPTGAGISLVTSFDQTGSDQCQLLSNQIGGFPDAGILMTAPVRDLICKLNIVDRCGNGILFRPSAPGQSITVENNHLRDIGVGRGAGPFGAFIHGIEIRNALSARTAGNTLQRIGIEPSNVGSIAGVAHFGVRRSHVCGNDIAEVGPPTVPTGARLIGINVLGPHEDCEITNNQIARDPGGAVGDTAIWLAVVVDEASAARPIVNAGDFTAVHLSTARALVLNGTHAFATEATLDFVNAAAPALRLSSANMRGNVIQARGIAPAVMLNMGLNIQFADNRCALTGDAPAVTLNCGVAAVTSNMVRSNGRHSIELSAPAQNVTVIGNVSSSEIVVNLQPLPEIWRPLNVRIS
jgi:hypothetical protein